MIKHLLCAGLVVLALTSCENFDNDYSEDSIKYDDAFQKSFGVPASNHQWGFDAAEYAMNGMATRAVYKQDMNIGSTNLRSTVLYGKPADITQKEHDEVFAWFSNHKVNWSNTPVNYNNQSTRQTDDEIAHVINTSYPGYGSLTKYSNPLGNYNINSMEVPFFNGWIQHVACDLAYDEIAEDKQNKYNGANMNYLGFAELGKQNSFSHANDFNASSGWGWGNQSSYNGILILDVNFNVVIYGSSSSSSLQHDKFYVVYLQGDDYAGWYVGMDYESLGGNANEIVKADGICNDWIIKIADAGSTAYNPARIMCEDLGHSLDWDFNDIVYDVEYRNNVCTITVQAAGGTLPVSLYYGEKDFGGIELQKNGTSDIHTLFGAEITRPVNVGVGTDGKAPVVFTLGFDGYSYNCDYSFRETFDFKKINIYVYHTDKSEWVNLANVYGSSPYRICVPTSVNWTRESQHIESAYPGFYNWVKDPTKSFWSGTTTNQNYLYY